MSTHEEPEIPVVFGGVFTDEDVPQMKEPGVAELLLPASAK